MLSVVRVVMRDVSFFALPCWCPCHRLCHQRVSSLLFVDDVCAIYFPTKTKAVFVLGLACLVDAGFSGDWQAQGVLSEAAADSARVACYTAAAAHMVLTGASAYIAQAKGADIASAAITLAVSSFLRFLVHYYCVHVHSGGLLRFGREGPR